MTALAWHPTTEGRLAFGTNEGRVGVFDTLAPAKAPWLSRSYHKGTVYNLNWAPAPGRPVEAGAPSDACCDEPKPPTLGVIISLRKSSLVNRSDLHWFQQSKLFLGLPML